jgi:ABC-type antimicrobial peptide transport system permease subunit
MNAVWMRLRSELRSRFGALVALGLIVGIMGGVVIAAAAGARRTLTAYPRFLAAENALDTVVDISGDTAAISALRRKVLALPQIKASAEVSLAQGYLRLPGSSKPGNVFLITNPDGRFGVSLNRAKILQGRMWNAQASNEIVPSFAVANDLDLHVGETVQMAPGGLFSDETPKKGPKPAPVPLHVVGIAAIPAMFAPLSGGYLPGVLLSPGFSAAHPEYLDNTDTTEAIRLRHGLADLPGLRDEIARIAATAKGVRLQFPVDQAEQTVGVQQTTRALAVAMWVLAALIALAGLAIFAQAMARQTFLESVEYPTLRSLGFTPQQLMAVGLLRAAVIGLMGAVIAIFVGYLLSPLTPTGLARIAEPHPGFAFDSLVVGLGAIAVVALVALVGAIPAWRAATAAWTPLGTAQPRGRRHSRLLGRLIEPLPPSGQAGIRMAVDPGAGRTAVPVRTATFGAAVSLVALAASLAFGASLDRLVSTPALSGWNWDALMFVPTPHSEELFSILDRSPKVSGYATGTIINSNIGRTGITLEALESRKGSVGPSMIEGHVPTGLHEIVLGTETMHDVGAHIGSVVRPRIQGRLVPMRVVGRIAAPNLFFTFTRPGQGGAISLDAAKRYAPSNTTEGIGVFVRFSPGVDVQAEVTAVKRRVPSVFPLPQSESSQLNTLNQLGQTPIILAGILALMAAATLAHTLITSIRRRRLDLAILKTLGFVRGQVSSTVAWQATAFGVMALVVGIPIGVIAGRLMWNVFADHLGVVPEAVVPAFTVLLAVPATILVANALAVVPGRIASKLRPATVLRTE